MVHELPRFDIVLKHFMWKNVWILMRAVKLSHSLTYVKVVIESVARVIYP